MGDALRDTLNADQAVLWQQYLSAEAEKLRPRFLLALSKFIEALQADSQERRARFAEMFCRQMADAGEKLPLREPLFVGIIGPYLVSAYQNGNGSAGHWTAYYYRFFNISSARNLLAGIGSPSPTKLLVETFRRNPDDVMTQNALIQEYLQQFAYAVHEVPSGVLYGRNGATIMECKEWLEDLALFRKVVQKRGVAEKYETEMHYWDFHFRGYADYLTHREQYRNYEEYINQHWQV